MKYFYILLLNLLAVNLTAKNYYVSAKNGKAEHNGLSIATPKKTIQQAANLTRPGDTVFVMNGTYTNSCASCNVVDIPKSGTKRKYIVYTNYPNQHPIIKFDGWAGISIKNGTSYVKVIGFEVIGNNDEITLAKALKQPQSCANKTGEIDPKYNGNGIVVENSGKKRSHHIVIANNIVHDCGGGGIGASRCDYVTIEENTVYNTSWYSLFGTSAIALYQFWNYNKDQGYHNIIRKNKCYNNKSLVPWIKMCKIYDGNGIIIDDFKNKQNGSKLGEYTGRTLIENNICWFNGGTGIHAFQSGYVDIINNTAYCNSRSKEFNPGQILSGVSNNIRIANNILVSDSFAVINSNYQNTRLTYENNLHYNVTHPDKAKIAVNSNTCVNGLNPLFVNPANSLNASFKLQAGSPAIRRANTTLFSPTDIEGNKRAQGKTADIGAYEY